ncbi:MAG: prephenate dehydratase [Pseudomonadota bacterium]
MTDNKKNLEDLRKEIDSLDQQLLDLISQRALVAKQVAEVKQAEDENTSFYRPEREAQILRKTIENNNGPLPDEDMARLFREIMSACLALEQPLDIAYLGPEGTFTQTAALKHFGHSVNVTAFSSIDQIFREVESGASNYGVVPVENSIEGVVNHTLDMLNHSSLLICGEVELRIHHHLLSSETDLTNIDAVYSHQQSLAQCRAWLDAHLMKAERISVNSNAEAAKIASEKKQIAAIASETAGELYHLNLLASNIEDEPDNTTRFLVIGKSLCSPSGNDKTSLIFSAPNKPGALHRMISCFADNGVSMTRIESRPSRREMWEYVFFVDVEGHVENNTVKQALADMEEHASMVKLLGSYPRAVL